MYDMALAYGNGVICVVDATYVSVAVVVLSMAWRKRQQRKMASNRGISDSGVKNQSA